MSGRAAPGDPGVHAVSVASVAGAVAVGAMGIAVALLLPAELLGRWAGRLLIALPGAAAGVLTWCLSRARAAAIRARRDAVTTVTDARNARRVERLLAQLPDAVVALDPGGNICVANASAAGLLGVRPEHVGRPFAEALSAPSLRAILAPVLAGTTDHETGDLADLLPDAVIHARVSRVPDGDGWLVLLCATDATRMRRLERLRHDFVANVSHELRTPITAIKGFVETMLDRRLYLGSNGKRFLRIAGAQAERLHALVEDLLSLSRIEQGEHDGIDATEQSLSPIVTRAIDACRSRLDVHRARIIDITGVDGVRVRANAPLLERALVNLLDNALLYGRDRASVHVSARSAEGARSVGGLRIDVTDDGPGIAAEHLDRVFERFYRVERDSRIHGSGLGLAIVKHIVQAHGGRVSVMSEVGSGTTVTLEIPP